MASFLSIFLFFFLFFFLHHRTSAAPSPQIQQACNATRFPESCMTSLSGPNQVPANPNPIQIIQAAISASRASLETTNSKMQALLLASTANINVTTSVKLGLESLRYSGYRINATDAAIPRGEIRNARAWMTAGLGFQAGVLGGLSKYVNETMVNETMTVLNSSIGIASNALCMIRAYGLFGNNIGSWEKPRTERDGFWEGAFGSASGTWNAEFPKEMKPDVTVCKGGACKYGTVQEAVNATPADSGKRFVIWIKAGVYDETVRIPLEKKNVVFLGDGMGKTVITGKKNVGMPLVSTRNTATVGVYGDGFMASNLTIENTAGPDAKQAVAFVSDSDLSIIENCEFLGHQDTLYANSLRQFYKSCRIEGTVDFIFGNSAAIFKDCTILVLPRQLEPEKAAVNVVTAHGRTDPAQATGYVFQDCVINGTDKYLEFYHSNPKIHEAYLGRPWKEFSRTVFINCVLGDLINPLGWSIWDGDFALQTLYFGESNCTGAGANTSKRVPWSSQIPADHVSTYSFQNFIQVDKMST